MKSSVADHHVEQKRVRNALVGVCHRRHHRAHRFRLPVVVQSDPLESSQRLQSRRLRLRHHRLPPQISDTANVVSIGGYHTKKSCSYQSFHIGDGGTTDLPTPFRRDQTDLGKVAEDSRIEAMKEMCKMPTNHYIVEDSSCSESDSTSSSEFDALD